MYANSLSSASFLHPTTTAGASWSAPPGTVAVRIKHILRGGVLLMGLSIIASFVLAVVQRQQTAWPLMNISQYAANYPGVYIFRVGTTMCAAMMFLISLAFWREARAAYVVNASTATKGVQVSGAGASNLYPLGRRREAPGVWTAVGFFLSAVGLGGAGVVSCYENNGVHTPLAFLLFVSQAAIQTGPLVCRSSQRKRCPRTRLHACRVACCIYLWISLLLAALIVSHVIPLGNHRNTTISVLEWTGTLELLLYLWWYAAQHDDSERGGDGDSNNSSSVGGFGSDAGSIGDDMLYNDI